MALAQKVTVIEAHNGDVIRLYEGGAVKGQVIWTLTHPASVDPRPDESGFIAARPSIGLGQRINLGTIVTAPVLRVKELHA